MELRDESWKYVNNYNLQKFQSKEKIKILIIGDSHSNDLFNAFYLNSKLFQKYEFVRYGDNYAKNSLNFDVSLIEEDLIKFKQSKVFNQSDIIIISDYFQDVESFDKLNIFLEMFKSKKKIILTSNSNIYLNPKAFNSYKLTLFDEFLLKNKKEKKFIDRNLSTDDKNEINNYYYQNLDLDKLNNINTRLKKIAEKHNVQIINILC